MIYLSGSISLTDEKQRQIYSIVNIVINGTSPDNTSSDRPHWKIESLSFCHLARLH